MDMEAVTWLIKAVYLTAFAGFAYFLHRMVRSAKPGKRVSIWWGGWLLHPEYLEEEGLIYRKKMVISWLGMLLMIMLMHFLHVGKPA